MPAVQPVKGTTAEIKLHRLYPPDDEMVHIEQF